MGTDLVLAWLSSCLLSLWPTQVSICSGQKYPILNNRLDSYSNDEANVKTQFSSSVENFPEYLN